MEVKQIFEEKQVQLCQSSAAWAGITSSRLEQGSQHEGLVELGGKGLEESLGHEQRK